MERPAILNRSMPSTAGATISIPPARAVDEAFFREVAPAVKNAIYNRYREYTRWRALFPGTFVPVLTRRLNYQVLVYHSVSDSALRCFPATGSEQLTWRRYW